MIHLQVQGSWEIRWSNQEQKASVTLYNYASQLQRAIMAISNISCYYKNFIIRFTNYSDTGRAIIFNHLTTIID